MTNTTTRIATFLTFILIILSLQSVKAQHGNDKIQIMFIGFDHLNQLNNGTSQSDVFSKKKQAELVKLNEHLKQFAPDMIMIEVEPKEQNMIDSIYALYYADKLKFTDLEYGRGETYQLGFRLARQLTHNKVYCIDHYEATSQSLLDKGENVELFQKELKKLQNTARPLKKLVQQDSLSLYEYIAIMNKPEMIKLTHNLFYNLPAVVVNGDFSDSGVNTVDLGKIDQQYIGAEFITMLYNRNLKIYSNILNAQMKSKNKRLLVIIGQTHVGVLQDLFEDNPHYTIVSPLKYLQTKDLDKRSLTN